MFIESDIEFAANEYFKAGRKSGPFTAHVHMAWSFFRSYILNAGFLDGYLGYTGCLITAMSSFLKYSKLRRLYSQSKKSGRDKR